MKKKTIINLQIKKKVYYIDNSYIVFIEHRSKH